MNEKKGYENHNRRQLQKIMSVTVELVKQKNINDITISDIAKASGLTRPTIYRYFPDKQSIFWAIFFEESQIMYESIRNLPAEQDIYLRLMSITQIMMESFLTSEENRIYFDVYLHTYLDRCEDGNYAWNEIPQNLYGYQPGKSVYQYFEGVIDLNEHQDVRDIIISFLYALAELMHFSDRIQNGIRIKYQIHSDEMFVRQVRWMLLGVKHDLYEKGYIDHLAYPDVFDKYRENGEEALNDEVTDDACSK